LTEPKPKPDAGPLVGLNARTEPGPGAVMGQFRFHGDAIDGGLLLDTDLPWLGGDLATEYWCVDGDVETGQAGRLAWACTRDLLLLSLTVPDDDESISQRSRQAYDELIDFLGESGFGHFIRLWNFLPRINDGPGDEERYRQFCLGRSGALEKAGIVESGLCAGTAIGTRGDRILIHALAARQPGIPVENPRQVAAYRYPRYYGPRSPSFARATGLGLADGRQGLLISGTASVVGHATRHPEDLTAQVDETICNMQALLEASAGILDCPGLARFGPESLLRVYLRDGQQWQAVYEQLRQTWPDSPIVGLEGDICRSDLLVEIEAWHQG